jgi:acetyl-CoA carboxylase biotin carboxylase subunit
MVANRGEIATRILRTLNALGVESVAVFTESDRDAPYLKMATKAVAIGTKAAYLSQESILQAALQNDCEAIHPGFGFLSENAEFARRCGDLKIAFIGPQPHLIALMGNKANARRTMAELGVPIMPGSKETVKDEAHLLQLASQIGLPILLKASAGGGGKGMRLVRDMSELPSAFASSRQEAMAAFGDDAIYVEKYLEGARHIEFQVLGDNFGHVVVLGDRECSIQRNHQKLLEEAPAPNLPPQLREMIVPKITEALSKLGYQNAGTMEFLLDQTGQLYFMEMNTRIQVEHPVTELTAGLDIVEWQIKVALGQQISLKQADIKVQGHAIECRLNAEDPAANFLPSPGLITKLRWPKHGALGPVRIDTHVIEMYRVSPFYDSMLAKVICHAPTRKEAVALVAQALSEITIDGIATTRDLHRAIVAHKEFVAGSYDCSFIGKYWGELSRGLEHPAPKKEAVVA